MCWIVLLKCSVAMRAICYTSGCTSDCTMEQNCLLVLANFDEAYRFKRRNVLLNGEDDGAWTRLIIRCVVQDGQKRWQEGKRRQQALITSLLITFFVFRETLRRAVQLALIKNKPARMSHFKLEKSNIKQLLNCGFKFVITSRLSCLST